MNIKHLMTRIDPKQIDAMIEANKETLRTRHRRSFTSTPRRSAAAQTQPFTSPIA